MTHDNVLSELKKIVASLQVLINFDQGREITIQD